MIQNLRKSSQAFRFLPYYAWKLKGNISKKWRHRDRKKHLARLSLCRLALLFLSCLIHILRDIPSIVSISVPPHHPFRPILHCIFICTFMPAICTQELGPYASKPFEYIWSQLWAKPVPSHKTPRDPCSRAFCVYEIFRPLVRQVLPGLSRKWISRAGYNTWRVKCLGCSIGTRVNSEPCRSSSGRQTTTGAHLLFLKRLDLSMVSRLHIHRHRRFWSILVRRAGRYSVAVVGMRLLLPVLLWLQFTSHREKWQGRWAMLFWRRPDLRSWSLDGSAGMMLARPLSGRDEKTCCGIKLSRWSSW